MVRNMADHNIGFYLIIVFHHIDEPDENALVESVVVGQRGGIDIKLVTNDEELTPLTWLQDKNLIQGKWSGFIIRQSSG